MEKIQRKEHMINIKRIVTLELTGDESIALFERCKKLEQERDKSDLIYLTEVIRQIRGEENGE